MNRICIDKEKIELKKVTKKIKVETSSSDGIFAITKIKIDILKDTDLELDFNLDSNKLDIIINLLPNVKCNIYEIKKGLKSKVQYTYNLDENSSLCINKFNYLTDIREMIMIYLKGENSSINYNFKSMSLGNETYDLVINHEAKKTNSNIKNNVINKDGKVSLQVSSYVPKGITSCIVNQNNRIINFSNNKCEIRPNLYIDEFDTTANHSALIGGFDSEEMFYLMTRGIKESEANKLLITGILLSDIDNTKMIKQILKLIKSYWR